MYALKQNEYQAPIGRAIPSRQAGFNPWKVVSRWLAVLGGLTGLAIFILAMQVRIDASFYRADEMKKENNRLMAQISEMRNEVSRQKSFANMASAREEFQINLVEPEEVFYLNLEKALSPTQLASNSW